MLIRHARPKALGHMTVSGPDGIVEHETFTCCHCQHVVKIPHRADPATVGGMCRQCMALTCPRCAAKGVCAPFAKKLEQGLRRDRFLKQVG